MCLIKKKHHGYGHITSHKSFSVVNLTNLHIKFITKCNKQQLEQIICLLLKIITLYVILILSNAGLTCDGCVLC